MAVDLYDLILPLKTELSVPGEEPFEGATDDSWVQFLVSAFWRIRMLGLYTNYTESDGVVSPIVGTTDLARQEQQLIILYAAINIVTNQLKGSSSVFRVKAGPTEYETQQSATLLKSILEELQRQRALVEAELFSLGSVTDKYIDSVAARDESLYYGLTSWVK